MTAINQLIYAVIARGDKSGGIRRMAPPSTQAVEELRGEELANTFQVLDQGIVRDIELTELLDNLVKQDQTVIIAHPFISVVCGGCFWKRSGNAFEVNQPLYG